MRMYYPLILLTISNIFMTFDWYGRIFCIQKMGLNNLSDA